MSGRSRLVYALLIAVLGLIALWQIVEHVRVRESARAALRNRSRDVTTTLGLVIRSQRRWAGVVLQDRLESALKELVKSGELTSVALLNAVGDVVAASGSAIDLETKGLLQTLERWDAASVTILNPVYLGGNVLSAGETNRPTIILPRREPGSGPFEDERGRRPPPPGSFPPGGPPPNPAEVQTNESGVTNAPPRLAGPEASPPRREGRPGPEGDRGGGPRFGRPFGMDEPEYQSLLKRRALHGLAIVMSTENYRRACVQDLWMRCLIAGFASASMAGLGLAWRNLVKSSDLQLRLLRASEMNQHLKQMNLAAAGLAHETRNPLNIIRGLAQMISCQAEAPGETQQKAREIVDEADRVTAQLNDFINFTRPREVRRAVVSVQQVVKEVVRALTYDLEEKHIELRPPESDFAVEADEQLLRQALFNLLLNAIQAVGAGGQIRIAASRVGAAEAVLEVCDNGPGVPAEQRSEIFKPYVTTHENGTGLGLAVVQQIVLAHGWEIECRANEPKGAVFRITHVGLASPA